MLYLPSPASFAKLTAALAGGALRRRTLAAFASGSPPCLEPEALTRLPFLSEAAPPELQRVITAWMPALCDDGSDQGLSPTLRRRLFGASELFGCLAYGDPVWMGAAENLLGTCIVDPACLPPEQAPALTGLAWFDESDVDTVDAWSLAPWSAYYMPISQLLEREATALYLADKPSLWGRENDTLLGAKVACRRGPILTAQMPSEDIQRATQTVFVGVLFGLITTWLELSPVQQSPGATVLEARWFVLREHLRQSLEISCRDAERGYGSIAWTLVFDLAQAVMRSAGGIHDQASQHLLLYLKPMSAQLKKLSLDLKPSLAPLHPLTPLADAAPPASVSAEPAPGTTKTALAGLKILDFTRLYPGPTATMMLAELGADVIRVEDPNRPDGMRLYPPYVDGTAAGYLAVNRAKRSIALDLSRPESKDVLARLVAGVDVVIEGFKPGTMARFGMGWEQLSSRFPHLVYVSLSGYGRNGPLADKAGHDLNYLAYSGFLGLNRDETGVPVMPGGQIADIAGGAYLAAFGVLTGVAARDRHGRGQLVDLAMLDGVMPLLGLQLAHHWAEDTPPGKGFLAGALACYRVYRCADDRFVALGALETKFWQAFCRWAGQASWAGDQFAQGAAQQALMDAVAAFFVKEPMAVWVARAEKENFCLAPVRSLEELADCPQLQAREMIACQTGRSGAPIRGVAPPLKLSMTPARVGGLAPEAGRDSHAVMAELGFSATEINALTEAGVVHNAAAKV